ncbi:conserved hypothetical protein [Dinoroseobacter shibae DFL 12 = DSM 16493]|uniref:Uncharacterized protein n=1 Tax=Dinoroseobacter shibae (strain DSM 16493 / NCIMB 14021 / DFL 12) TaxID=398580 RepID=A8LRJ4_DINSH|nr:hypothetical protein [Dinoroseobacter shibae]ABV92644.1 conserved hypothetical protein [Dinoroseobacter shibae DFL 12 = DSM 16493]URF47582.1 hypothetical protein M8008_04635 [Dinoroseobacter shibae]URF51892.1 hypothetical protein M8007_04635 [Dinoroseobacter shibae]
MIALRPDPAHPRGGYAELSLDAAVLDGDAAAVEVFDLYGERFLGPEGWQPERHAFGPYPIDRAEGSARIVVGPEIVDKLEEFAALRLTVGGVVTELSWPEQIVHSPKAATSDTAIKVGDAPAPAAPAAPIRMAEPEPEPAPEPEPTTPLTEPEADTPPEPEAADTDETEEKSLKLPLVLGGLALVGAAAVAAFFLLQPEEVVETPPPPPAPAPAPAATAPDPCAPAELEALASQGFGALGPALRNCGGAVSADTALGLLEEAVAQNDPAALAFFGTLYDAAQTDAVIEEQIGLTLGDDPARAAEYYARARDAGSAEAEALLSSVCLTLMLKTDTLSASAREDFCGN